ncbi:unnamed protein product [Gulo gulo]|uniref:Uncharacterized protein n=1 Tax=Gulo gulo TaxID=48420 RepID=A0A9X9M3V1_GULGU|nr:unnamed protein product [Gulo gulo]
MSRRKERLRLRVIAVKTGRSEAGGQALDSDAECAPSDLSDLVTRSS